MPEFNETVEVVNDNGITTVRLISNSATVSAGGGGIIGGLVLGESGIVGVSPIVTISGNGVARFGGTNHPGEFSVRDAANERVLHFEADSSRLTIGGEENSANVRLVDGEGHTILQVGAVSTGGLAELNIGEEGIAVDFRLVNRNGETVMSSDGFNQSLKAPILFSHEVKAVSLDLDGSPGGILNIFGVSPDGSGPSIRMEGRGADVRIGRQGISGDLEILNDDGRRMFDFSAQSGRLELGGEGLRGDVLLRASSGKTSIVANGDEGVIGVNSDGIRSYHLRNEFASLWLGAPKNEGDLVVWDDEGVQAMHLDGDSGLRVRDKTGRNLLYARRLPAPRVFIGDNGANGQLLISDNDGNHTISMSGNNGLFVDGNGIALVGGDCAEEFDVVEFKAAEPGTVMRIGKDGRLEPCDSPNDSRVAGIVSGAGDIRPGIKMGVRRYPDEAARVLIALSGTVMCKADASYGPIRPGDLLTTSATTGYARRVDDPAAAISAIIGKALQPLEEGQKLIRVLVSPS